jgi:hypothetical protein
LVRRAGSEFEPGDLARVLVAISGSTFRAHVEFLADDLLKGRETGTEGYDLAALYVATELKSMGVEPAGEDGSYFQPVTLRESRLLDGKVLFAPSEGGAAVALEPLVDYVQSGDALRTEARVTAPVVFVGFGVTAPDLEHDDYADTDVTGKIVALLWGAPARFPSEHRAHFSSRSTKAANAARHGAVGLLFFQTAEDLERVPWERIKEYSDGSSTRWLRSDGTPEGVVVELKGTAMLSPAGARRLFASSPVPIEDVLEQAAEGEVEGFALPVTATIEARSEHRSFVSANVVGVVKGSDPALADTSAVYTAHLDHVGEDKPVNGDSIYNGAYDNATGSAVVLEIARAFTRLPSPPRRSVVFLFVTAEEKGLLGSDYFAKHPTSAAGKIVANVNIDMPILLHPITTVVALGIESSTLKAAVNRGLAEAGLTLIPDPTPEENSFVRSDQYSFVLQGVPSINLNPGVEPSDAETTGGRLFKEFLKQHYHRPSDDLSRPMDLDSVERFIRANFVIGYAVASDPEPPRWNPGDFFGETFGKAAGAH